MATKTHTDKVLKAVGKRPQSASQIATKLGYPTHHGVARTLGGAVKRGEVVKSEKGYAKK
jgi:hypothetical protein